MPLTTSSKTLFTILISGFLAVVVIGYAIFSARHIITGPIINVSSPKDGEVLSDNFADIRGVSENLNYISLNDRQIFIDDNGNFREKLLLYPGLNILKFYGKDKFGREITKNIRVIGSESTSTEKIGVATSTITASSSPPTATSSPVSTSSPTSNIKKTKNTL